MKDYKLVILAAGVGARMGALSDHVNKAVLPVNFKAAISYIIEKFSKEIEVVIAVGHKKETIVDYLELAYPERKFTYVDVDKYVGPGTGPGYSLLKCKPYLQCPFVFFSADTIVLEDVPEPNVNWFGIAPIRDPERFCTVKIKNNLIYQIDDKVKCDNKYAFIGAAGVCDYEFFWDALENNKDLIDGEIQVSNGFKKLIEKKLTPIGFTWFDTGTMETYVETNKNFAGKNKSFDFSKGNEFLYFVNGRVIKYFADAEITKNRYERSKHLAGLCPVIEGYKNNYYSYKKVEGDTLYNTLNRQVFNDFLEWAESDLWRRKELSEEQQKEFKDACHKFYYDKTMMRLKMFYDKTNIPDTTHVVNGVTVPALGQMMSQINWEYLTAGIPSNFHGDLQFDNVLFTRDKATHLPKFILLDWRQDVGGLVEHGDLYYDLAKMYGGMILSYQLIKDNMFSFDMSGSSVYYNFFIKNDLLEAKEIYEEFIKRKNYDLKKVRLLTALIFLNMSPLHNDPFDTLLYFLGKNMLHKALENIKKEEKNGF
ncbi:hypothetical protein CL616_02870 [archaeon]|nr:hypothetical protein [archaeon]